MTSAPRRKLIEVALPLDAINAASAREKSIRHGHPSTLHLWWARRPLAACRAVLFAQLVDDPSSRPEEFPTEEDQDRERERLFGIIGELVKWENSTNETVLEAARAEILKSTDGDPPPILDPFAGGGSIPLEAQRLGLEAHASDLNPVAVLINKALIEIPPKWADQPPVHPDAERRTHWRGAEGLAEDVRLYGKWMRDEAERRIGHLYPKAKLEDGSEATVLAWIWARTVTCPNPACRATMPLASTLWLSKRRGNETYLDVSVADGVPRFEIRRGFEGPGRSLKVGSRGARFRCVACSEVAEAEYVQDSLGSTGDVNMARAVATPEGRRFLPGNASFHATGADRPLFPDLSRSSRHMGGVAYGLVNAAAFYTDRQLKLMQTLAELVEPAVRLCVDHRRSNEDAYADDLRILLAISVSKMARFHTSLSTWRADEQKFSRALGGPAMQMSWDYAEANPFGGSGGDVLGLFQGTADALSKLAPAASGHVELRSALQTADLDRGSFVVCTDPPYYDNVPYSDLADFFYVWLRLALALSEPDLFATALTPKEEEIVADAARSGSANAAEEFFQTELMKFFTGALWPSNSMYPMSIFYAFKQGEKILHSEDLLASTGWSTMLEGLISAGWQIVATWPMLTEGRTRRRGQGSNALMSSVVLVCRPRANDARTIDRRGLLRALRQRLPTALAALQKSNIEAVDIRQAAIGPGMEVFSSYARVIEGNEERMPVRAALALINQLFDEVLGEQEAGFDSETRWAIQWFADHFEAEGEYGVAERLALPLNISVDGLRQSGIVESGGGKVRLLGRAEYPDAWDPLADTRVPVWEACQHLVKRLEEQGEAAAGALLARLEQRGGLGEAAQLLAYRLFTVCERERPALAGPYNALIAAWPEIQRQARTQPTSGPAQQTAFDT